MARALVVLALNLLAGCGPRPLEDAGASVDASRGDGGQDRDGGGADARVDPSLDAGRRDAGHDVDAGRGFDAGHDAGSDGGRDAGRTVDAGRDAGTPARADHHIHIDVDNFCNMTVSPTEITVPAGQTAYFDWHNHSRDYPVDVWMSYGGGYTDLPMGATWDEPIGHCATPSVHTEWADISTACSSFRFLIRCN